MSEYPELTRGVDGYPLREGVATAEFKATWNGETEPPRNQLRKGDEWHDPKGAWLVWTGDGWDDGPYKDMVIESTIRGFSE